MAGCAHSFLVRADSRSNDFMPAKSSGNGSLMTGQCSGGTSFVCGGSLVGYAHADCILAHGVSGR